MSRVRKLRYWLFNQDKKPLYTQGPLVLEGSPVTLLKADGQPAFLTNSPTGWRDTFIKYARNIKYLGLFRDYSVPVEFALDGAKIIRTILFNAGFNAELFLGISKLDEFTFPATYKDWYYGEIDLSKFRNEKDTITVSITEGGPSKYLKAFENVEYELDIANDTQAKSIYFDGIPFRNKVEWTVYEQGLLGGLLYTIGIGIISEEGRTQGVLYQDQTLQGAPSSYTDETWMFKSVSKTTTVNVSGTIKINVTLAAYVVPIYILKINFDGSVNTTYSFNSISLSVGVHDIAISASIPVTNGDKLYFIIGGNPGQGVPAVWLKTLSGIITLEYDVRFTGTFAQAYTAQQLGEKLVAKMTDNKYQFKSNALTALTGLLYTCAPAIRQISDAKFKFSFENFFKSLRRLGLALGIEGDFIRIELHAYFFRTTTSVTLGEVKELSVELAEDMVYNTIKTGYGNYTYDKVNGLDEFNVQQNWKTNITKVVKELDLTSPARADMYGIEITRADYFRKDTTDSSSDTDVYMIDCVQGGTYLYYEGQYVITGTNTITIPNVLSLPTVGGLITIGGTQYAVTSATLIVAGSTTIQVSGSLTNGTFNGQILIYSASAYLVNRPAYAITGLINPSTAYNINLSPKRAFGPNGSFIHSFVEDDSSNIEFTSGEKNSDMVADGLIEKANVPVSTLAPRLFKPYYLNFEAIVPNDFLSVMATNPYGLITFTYRGNTYSGYLWDGGVKPATRDAAKFKLLCGPNTNLLNLID
jgi:hypothetical protein